MENKTPSENILSVLKGKKVLFLENGLSLDNGLDLLEKRLKENKIKYKALFNLGELDHDKILKEIDKCDCIVFMTQWVYEVSHKLRDYMFALKEKKIVIEVYISEPTWYYKPKSAHDVYIYTARQHGKNNPIEFYELTQNPYWDYKNNFNK